jgi:hypothetical protein
MAGVTADSTAVSGKMRVGLNKIFSKGKIMKLTFFSLFRRDIIIVTMSVVILIVFSSCSKKTESESVKNSSIVKQAEQKPLSTGSFEANTSLPEFIENVPVTFHPAQSKKISLKEKDITSLKVSPDGQKVVYTGTQDSRQVIGLIDLLSGDLQTSKLQFDNMRDVSWYADGNRIIFAAESDGSWEIYLYDLGTQALFQITSDNSRKKSWPRCSPYKFNGHYRIAYVSEVNNRKDLWWVRENGQYDMPITQEKPQYDSCAYWDSLMPAPPAITTGGDLPEWSPSGNLLLYRTKKGYSILNYDYFSWWQERKYDLPKAANAVITWSPNQTNFLLFDSNSQSASVVSRSNLKQQKATTTPVTAIDYFPDGQWFACGTHDRGQCSIEIVPYNDPLGDVSNLWMYPYSESQKNSIAENQLLFLNAGFDQMYNVYETERYSCGAVSPNFPARPYIITSDAILETFYAAFASLYGAMEQFRQVSLLKEFSKQALQTARERNALQVINVYFETALGLLDPVQRGTISAEAATEIGRIEKAEGGMVKSLWGKEIDYSDFYIRGKYEEDTAAQNYFRAIKWYQTFTFNLDSAEDRKCASEINAITSAPQVLSSLQKIYTIYQKMVGESRYLTPVNAGESLNSGNVPSIKTNLPWITIANRYRLFPSIATLDFHIFNELVTHTDRPVTVGTIEEPRVLPKGLDIMACFGSDEARDILCKELHEDQYKNYLTTLSGLKEHIRDYSQECWGANLYQQWLYILKSLISDSDSLSPSFMKTTAWKRKQLNTALSSWVNLRYETIAVVEQGAAECGEGGYEELNIGKPKGYVEPNPEFFKSLDEGFSKINDLMEEAFDDSALTNAAQKRIVEFRSQIQSLGRMAEKELKGMQLSDAEYNQILEIGGAIEQFILIMGSLKGDENGHAIGLPDPVSKIVDVQKAPDGTRLYEALGDAKEINVVVPYAGRRQIAKGSVYSYYEFTSTKHYTNKMWREEEQRQLPSWIQPYYDGQTNPRLDELPDLK